MYNKDGTLKCFKAYDVRGRVPEEFSTELAECIGHAYAAQFSPKGPVALGRDIRESGPKLAAALARGLNTAGVDTVDIGICGTEMVYHAAAQTGMGGGIMVTASHNPPDYNGLKFVREGALPVSEDTGLLDLERRTRQREYPADAGGGKYEERDVSDDYLRKVLSFIDPGTLKPMTVVVNGSNGCAGPIASRLAESLPGVELVPVCVEPNPKFPNGPPNPMDNDRLRSATADAVLSHRADLGVAWDGDFDRCFFFDEMGGFIEGYYLVGLLAKWLLRDNPGGSIVHDPRLVWNTIELVEAAGGKPVPCRSGHAFIKERLRTTNAFYGGEMSAHHYFRDFHYCDSGMIPWLLVMQILSEKGRPLSELVGERMRRYPCSGEINRKELPDPDATMACVLMAYGPSSSELDSETDGLSFTFGDRWRFNLRKSNTEPTIRLNVESRGNRQLMAARTAEILALIDEMTAALKQVKGR